MTEDNVRSANTCRKAFWLVDGGDKLYNYNERRITSPAATLALSKDGSRLYPHM